MKSLAPALAILVGAASLTATPAPSVTTRLVNDKWEIRGEQRLIVLDPTMFALRAESERGPIWHWLPSTRGDLKVRHGGLDIDLQLASAADRQITPYATGYGSGLKVSLRQFPTNTAVLDLELQIFLTLQGADEDLVCEILASDGEARVQELAWPASLRPESFDTTVVPFMQGMLLPKDWPEKAWLYDTLSYGRGLYMPWWGFQNGTSALLVVLETPDDAGCRFEHPPGGPTRIDTRWVNSLGRWAYPRVVRFCFLRSGNYVDLAKRYRRHVQERGNLVTLKEKIARNPRVGEMIGTPIIHTSILYHIQPESSYYHKDDPGANHQLVTFTNRARELDTLAQQHGIRRAYVHLDGWGMRGYDNLHPDILPPCPEAGGWQGMKALSQTCDALGFIFAIHDQYRDFYLDAPSYDKRHTVIDPNGQRPLHSTWYGGRQSILCSRLAPGYVRRNHQALLDHGILLRGAYLDVFSVVPPDECRAPEHPVTRSECLRYRGEALDFIRSYGGVVSSEEPSGWSVPHLDLVHHGPYALRPDPGKGPAMAIPVPLFNLVYHDALLTPWSLGRGGWGLPEKDLGFLHGLGNAGLPYLSLQPSDQELQQVRLMCALHQRVGLLELTNHRFLDSNRRRQEFTFADGTRITIDLDRDSHDVQPPLATSTPQVSPRQQ